MAARLLMFGNGLRCPGPVDHTPLRAVDHTLRRYGQKCPFRQFDHSVERSKKLTFDHSVEKVFFIGFGQLRDNHRKSESQFEGTFS